MEVSVSSWGYPQFITEEKKRFLGRKKKYKFVGS
jgi:hypothetical protein